MWLYLSGSIYNFGPTSINIIKEVDMRDPTRTYVYKSELYNNANKIDIVKESVQEIALLLKNNVDNLE